LTENKIDCIVIGDINIDIITAPIESFIKEVSIIQDSFNISIGGNAANTAFELSSLGFNVYFIGALGPDPISKWLIAELEKYNINHGIVIKEKSSGITIAITFQDGTRTFIATNGSNRELEFDDIQFDNIKASHLHRGGYWWAPKLMGKINDEIFKNAKTRGMTTSLSLSWDPNNWKNRHILLNNLKNCDILFLNENELKGLSGKTNLKDSISYLRKNYSELIVIHKGAEGSIIVKNNLKIKIKANKIKVINPTGSGDVYDAAFIYGFKKGWDLEKIGKFANACAEVHLQNLNKKYPTYKDVENYLKNL